MLKKARQTFLWTLFYAAAATAAFYALFRFNIWSSRHWAILSRMTLHGADGFFMGAMIVAFVPAYLATAFFVWKNGKWPISWPAFFKKKKDEKKDDKNDDDAEIPALPDDLPAEMIAPYIRVKNGTTDTAAYFIKQPALETGDNAGSRSLDTFMPPPESFDAAPGAEPEAPQFTDLLFGDDSPIEIKDGVATYVFDQPGFWIADDDNWFAEGRQIKSPVAELLVADAASRELVLKNQNINDIDELIPKWEKLGIKISGSGD